MKRENEKKARDGWHKVYGYHVYVEDGMVTHGTDDTYDAALYPYRSIRGCGGWHLAQGYFTLDGLRSAIRNGSAILH